MTLDSHDIRLRYDQLQRLSLVSTEWRDFVRSHESFWSVIHASQTPRMIEKCLTRSHDSPLEVQLTALGMIVEGAAAQLMSHTHRIRTLSVDLINSSSEWYDDMPALCELLRRPFPALRHLSVASTLAYAIVHELFYSKVYLPPQLHTFHLSKMVLQFPPPREAISNLRHLTLNHAATFRHMCAIMPSCPQIESLDYQYSGEDIPSPAGEGDYNALIIGGVGLKQNLKRLKLGAVRLSTALRFLEAVGTPSLDFLDVTQHLMFRGLEDILGTGAPLGRLLTYGLSDVPEDEVISVDFGSEHVCIQTLRFKIRVDSFQSRDPEAIDLFSCVKEAFGTRSVKLSLAGPSMTYVEHFLAQCGANVEELVVVQDECDWVLHALGEPAVGSRGVSGDGDDYGVGRDQTVDCAFPRLRYLTFRRPNLFDDIPFPYELLLSALQDRAQYYHDLEHDNKAPRLTTLRLVGEEEISPTVLRQLASLVPQVIVEPIPRDPGEHGGELFLRGGLLHKSIVVILCISVISPLLVPLSSLW